ncbi:MAG TPA: MotA/TolQ/ExbB proton channel family protein [Acidobacteriota bacterium]|nr:MotA/TolQ/ExbB proton channel family protein [Acidobacteriota bacterium]
MIDLLRNLALTGGTWVLYLLIFSSVLSVAVMIQKAVFFWRNRLDWGPFTETLSNLLKDGNSQGAITYLSQIPTPPARVVMAGLQNIDRGPEAVEEVLIGKRIAEKIRMESRLMILGTMGNNAPFVGLFGTVLGIIKAFHALSVVQNPNPSVVMAGVSEALIATAVGLLVAIPAVIAYNYFQRKVKEMVSQMDAASRIVLVYLKSKEKV